MKDIELWSETDAIELANDLLAWMRAEDENIFFDDFLYISDNKEKYKSKIYPDLIKLLSEKYSSFYNIINECKGIEQAKIKKFGAFDKLNSSIVRFLLTDLDEKPKKEDKRIGNKFWELRSKHGRNMLFETPDLMWEAACEYFAWCEENPLIEVDYRGKDLSYIEIPKMRPYTLHGLCIYLDASTSYWREFKNSGRASQNDFMSVVTRIEEVIYNQKFSGAASGFLNPNIIARDLGLIDKQDIKQEVTISELTPEQRAARIAELKNKMDSI